jgi:hypothetical protein
VDVARQKQLAGIYLGSRDMELAYADTGLCLRSGRKCYEASFTAPDTIVISRPPVDLSCRFFADALRDPAYATCDLKTGPLRIIEDMPFNGSPFDPAGPGKPEWNAYAGTYELWQWGKPAAGFELRLDRGWLTFGKYRVVREYEPGLFFLADGEALDLRKMPATWRNIPLVRRPR